jgi:peptidoglycan/LPS O-acetylase OafA/YrhL
MPSLASVANQELLMKLASVTQGKNNNFNLIRILAAFAVLVAHSYALLDRPDPFGQALGIDLGSFAVDVFFIASGFLVTGSLLLRQSLRDYFLARVLRIYPALLVVLLLTVFVLGAFFTTLSLASYYSHPQIYLYLKRCLTLVTGAAYYLPGVFEDNPYKSAVNGSLWSMVYEVKMYISLAIFWALCSAIKQYGIRVFRAVIVVSAVVSAILVLVYKFSDRDESQSIRLFFMFFSGAAYWILKDRVRLSAPIFGSVCAMLIVSALLGETAFFLVYQLSIAYLLFYLAYVPADMLRKYNTVGDYSYGVYIYAFPIQQSLIALLPKISVLELTLLSGALTLVLAALSWHLIERRALDLKNWFLKSAKRETRLLNHPASPV